MPRGFEQHTDLAHEVIAACYEVHSVLGPGLEERFYREALCYELEARRIKSQREQEYAVRYKGRVLGTHRVDLVVEDKVLIELKAVTGKMLDVHVAQTISERRASQLPVALLIASATSASRFAAWKPGTTRSLARIP
jgi:GxxExxY protein